MKMNTQVIPIRGMHCRSCELLIEDQLKALPGVERVKVSLKKSQAELTGRGKISQQQIEKAVAEAGYEVGEEAKLPWLTRDIRQYDELALVAGAVALVFFFLKLSGIWQTNFNFSGSPASLAVVVLIGLTAGFSTCMALVGGLVLGVSAQHAARHPEASRLARFRPHLFFNGGRIASYFILGGMIGLLGTVFQLSGLYLGIMTILTGLVMLLLGLQLTQLSPRLSRFTPSLPSAVGRWLKIKQRHQREYSHRNAAVVGALTFFLPCGFTQAMQLYAMSTGSFWSGAAIMGVFALGTAPGLLGVGGLTSTLKGAAAQRFFKVAGVVVVALGAFNIVNGLNLTGLTAGWQSEAEATAPAAVRENGSGNEETQVVKMDQVGSGYRPNKFTVKAGVPVKWIVTSRDPYSCASSLYAKELGIQTNLQPGENVFEFTPQETGKITFSCGMGMYTGWFNVIEG